MKIFPFILIGLLILSGCGEKAEDKPKTQIDIQPRVRMIGGENQELFERIMTPSQTFDLNLKKDTLLECAGGTTIYLPEKCFINAYGEAVTDNVKLEIVEALTPGDFFRNNLQTIAGDKILESAGMIYIDATANGQNLAIAEGNSIRVEIPALAEGPGYKIFSGDFDKTGNIDWKESGELENEMIPLPLSEFDFHYFKRAVRKEYQLDFLDSIPITDAKFENTYIATSEFADRFYYDIDEVFSELGDTEAYRINAFRYEDFHIQTTNFYYNEETPRNETVNLNNRLLNIYLDNTDKPLYVADSMAHALVRSREIQDSITLLDGGNGNYYYFKWRSERFKKFMDKRENSVAYYDPRGVNMSGLDPKAELMKKGYSASEANKQIKIHKLRESKIAARKAERKRIQDRIESETKIQSTYKTAFEVTELGWINCDRFMNDPNAKPVELAVKTKGDSLPFCDVTLFFPNRNLALKGHFEKDGCYHFTGNAAPYTKLPVNEEVLIVAMSSKKSVPYFGLKKFTIKEKQDIDVKMEASTWEAVHEKLKGI